MSSEKLKSNYRETDAEKPAWKVERERDLAKKRKIGEAVLGVVAAAMIGAALSHSAKTSEIMENEERAKNVKKIEVEGIVFHDEMNVRKEPVVDNMDPNQLASIGEEGGVIIVDYDGDGYYYENENDANGGWYGFEAAQLSDELLEDGYISSADAKNMKSDEKHGDGTVWLNEKYVSVIEAGDADAE